MAPGSICSLVWHPVSLGDYRSLSDAGFKCRELSDDFVFPEKTTGSYLFQEIPPATGESSEREDAEEAESSRPRKVERVEEDAEEAESNESSRPRKVQRVEPEAVSTAAFKILLEVERRNAERMWEVKTQTIQAAMEQLRSDMEERLRTEVQRLELEQGQMKSDIYRLRAYQDAGTCKKLATTALLESACNILSWGLRRFISRDIRNNKLLDVTRESLFGRRNRPFVTWNDVTYSRLQWTLYWAWRDQQLKLSPTATNTSLLEYWNRQGYPGTVLREPRGGPRKAPGGEQRKNLEIIGEYLKRAERSLGLPITRETISATEEEDKRSRERVRILCGVYVTGIVPERNEEVHLFSLHPGFWDCDMPESEREQQRRERQEEELMESVSMSKVKDAKIVPKLKSFDVRDLQVKLRVLDMVLGDIGSLPEFFTRLEEDIRLVARLVRRYIGQAAGFTVLRSPEGLEMSGTSLSRVGERGVRSSKTGKSWEIDDGGSWRNKDGSEFDPSGVLLGVE